MNYKKKITELSIKNFKLRYPDLDVMKLIPTYAPNLQKVNLEGKEITQININPVSLSAICGTVLGDSNLSVSKGYKNARIQARHSTRQTDWFMWKSFCILNPFINETSILFQLPDGHQKKSEKLPGEILGKWKISTKVDNELTKLRDIIAPNNKKTVKRKWLNHMNNYFLMALWLDDGSLSKGRQGVISVNSMPLDQAQVLADYITTVWGVSCKATIVESKRTSTNPEPVQIEIEDQDNLEKFLRIIAPIIPVESMIYKVCFCPLDSSHQERWASELKTLVREQWHDTIEKYLAYLSAIQKSEYSNDSESEDSEEDIVQ